MRNIPKIKELTPQIQSGYSIQDETNYKRTLRYIGLMIQCDARTCLMSLSIPKMGEFFK
jgi:hypothetical protein